MSLLETEREIFMHFHFYEGHFARGREKVKLNKDAKNY